MFSFHLVLFGFAEVTHRARAAALSNAVYSPLGVVTAIAAPRPSPQKIFDRGRRRGMPGAVTDMHVRQRRLSGRGQISLACRTAACLLNTLPPLTACPRSESCEVVSPAPSQHSEPRVRSEVEVREYRSGRGAAISVLARGSAALARNSRPPAEFALRRCCGSLS